MDSLSADMAIQAILGREGDFVNGIDNDALDFSQLEDFINGDASQANANYFGESLSNPQQQISGKLITAIDNKRANGHSLPESPPDSSSEHPYSPQENCEPPMTSQEPLYNNLYKPALLNPILTDNLILGSHIVVTESNEPLLDNSNVLMDNRLLTTGMVTNTNVLNPRIQDELILSETDPNYDRLYQPKEEDFVHLGYSSEQLPPQNMVYTNLQTKKRKLSQDGSTLVKSEPEHCTQSQLSPNEQLNNSLDEDYASSEACLSESQYQCIRFNAFQQNSWHVLCDQNLSELPVPHYRVDADKGFNFSNADDAFVCQKKNHFQVTCHVQLVGDAKFVKTPEGLQKISNFHLHFYGVKHDCPTQTIRVEQSQSDRSKKPFHPVLVELANSQVTKVTVGRLHFSETTSNNMRKKGKPNPEQRYFQLVVGLHAHTANGNFPIVSHASQKIIVRASNPGQFESDVELCWQKGQTQDSVYHNGKVGINTDRPDESLVVHGNIKITGHIIQPSDIRAKKNIVECNTAEQLRNVQKLRVVKYEYEPSCASQLSREKVLQDTGVIAQEVAQVLPEAVKPAGDLVLPNGTAIENFLVVNKERIFMENIGAVKELCKVTDNLETRIDQLERMNRRLNKLKRGDSLKSNSTVSSKVSYHKCSKHHKCNHEDPELCSNKFIQVVIVVLILIMAFCLASITTLYFIESSRISRYPQGGFENHSRLATKRPTKGPKVYQNTVVPDTSSASSDLTGAMNSNFQRTLSPIGRPDECLTVDQYLEHTSLCSIYCCGHQIVAPPPESSSGLFSEEKPINAKNKTINAERNKISDDIDKQVVRQRRNTIEQDETNFFDSYNDSMFSIFIEGVKFNTQISSTYLESKNKDNNFTYNIPISKYMPDESIKIIFRSSQSKEVNHCEDYKRQDECSMEYNDKSRQVPKIDEHSRTKLEGSGVSFKVNMVDFQSKLMTYRVSLRSNLNACKLSNSKLGIDFVEYNFHFFRQCSE